MRLYFDSPTNSMQGHPCFEVVIVILLIRNDCHEMLKVRRIDLSEHFRGSNTIIQSCTRHHDGHQQARCID